MKLAVVLAIVLAATFACVGCAARAVKRGLDYHVMKAAGADAINCGRIQFPRAMPHVLNAEQSAQIASCIDSSRTKRLAFFFSAGGPGIDSDLATGLVGAADGRLARFWYDSAPCGGPHCDERFRQRDCPPPSTTEPVNPTTFCAGSTK
jgi:hypothetical protein